MEDQDRQDRTADERQGPEEEEKAVPRKDAACDDKVTAGEKAAADTGRMVKIRESEIQELRRGVQDYKDKYVRLFAEFDNARKRFEREKLEFVKYANEGLIIEFLNILDDLQRSVDAAGARHQDYASFLKGVEMIMAHLYDMLKRNGLRPIEAAGKQFDPHTHEVLMQVETDRREEDGRVVEEFQKGYLLGDRVIRTAKVKVAVHKTCGNGGQDVSPADASDEGQQQESNQNNNPSQQQRTS